MSDTSDIPDEFYKSEVPRPVARTVKEFKEHLAKLPDDLRVEMGFGVAELVVFNVKDGPSGRFLSVRESDE